MNIIEIDSSESEDDIEIGYTGSQHRSFNDDASDQWRNTCGRFVGQNHDLGLNLHRHPSSSNESTSLPRSSDGSRQLGNSIKSNGREEAGLLSHELYPRDPQLNDPAQNTQRRTLPSSFQPTSSKTSLKPSLYSYGWPGVTSQQESPEAEPDNRSEFDLNNTANGRQKFDPTLLQHTQKKSLPSSPQLTIRTAPVISKDCSAGNQIHKLHGTTNDSMRSSASDWKVGVEDDLGKRKEFHINGYDDKRRILPSSLINSNSVANSQPKTSTKGANAVDGVHRLPASSFRNEKLITTPRVSTKSKDEVHIYGDAAACRVLPPSLIHGKSVNSFQSIGANDAGHRSGLGEARQVEHDERPIYQEALQNLAQPKLEDDLPDGLLTVPLLKHQKIALAWMVQKEKSHHCTGGILADDQGLGKTVSMIALIQKQRTQQTHFQSHDSNHAKSETLNLDVDDDEIVELDKTKQVGKDDERKQVASTSMHASRNGRLSAGTLVVCPASVLRQWARELDEKVTTGARLSVLIYHGGTRTRDPGDLAKYDVVLTTYSIVTNEVPKQSADDDDGERNLDKCSLSSEFSTSQKRKQTGNGRRKGKKKGKGLKDSHLDFARGPLARVRWFRVILDEAQTIKNHRTQVANACCGLRANRRWCLSGTPIQNAIDDLYSYFRFLKYDPYSGYNSFCTSIKYPISRNASQGYKKLQIVLRTLLLRRTKGTLIDGEPVIKLPPKSICLKKVDFSLEERSFYLRLEADSRKQFKAYAAAGTVKQNYANILLMLLRLRQACDHPILVKGFHSDPVGKDSSIMATQLPREMQINLLNQLEGSLAICGVCNDTPEDAVVTLCGHVFCYQCVSECVTADENLCPVTGCKEILGTDSIFSRATLKSCLSDELDNYSATTSSSAHDDGSSIVQSGYVSSKIRAALEILNSLCSPSYCVGKKECNFCQDRTFNSNGLACTHLNSNPDIPAKAIVFSQWTSMLDLLELSLNQSLIQYRRLDGTMSLTSRDRAVRDFNGDPEVTVMIMSLKAGNLGLNMVAACHVILLDLWWNPTTEDQAVDRAHRIGQTRPVIVSRLTVKDTVEDRILALQEEKRKLVSSAFGEDQTGGHATRLTVEDLRYLFMGQ